MTISGASRQAGGTQKSTAVDRTGQIIDKVVLKFSVKFRSFAYNFNLLIRKQFPNFWKTVQGKHIKSG